MFFITSKQTHMSSDATPVIEQENKHYLQVPNKDKPQEHV